ncbi:MAG: ABC transporter transmembrane domain-containing protein [Clostridium sp.]|nr:ABC transporter transmembrane domain-containing protein [Clostridium sp.]
MLLKIKNICGLIKRCLKLGWHSSKKYTITRIACQLILPISTILMSFYTKNVMNVFASNNPDEEKVRAFLGLIICFLLINLLNIITNHITTYVSKLHNDIIEKDMQVIIMEKTINVDLEYFDNPKYYDQLHIAIRDSQSLIYVIWNIIDFFAEIVSVV